MTPPDCAGYRILHIARNSQLPAPEMGLEEIASNSPGCACYRILSIALIHLHLIMHPTSEKCEEVLYQSLISGRNMMVGVGWAVAPDCTCYRILNIALLRSQKSDKGPAGKAGPVYHPRRSYCKIEKSNKKSFKIEISLAGKPGPV